MTLLTKPSTFDEVAVGAPVHRKGFFTRLLCAHRRNTTFRHWNYLAGHALGSLREGFVCRDCGHVLKSNYVLRTP